MNSNIVLIDTCDPDRHAIGADVEGEHCSLARAAEAEAEFVDLPRAAE